MAENKLPSPTAAVFILIVLSGFLLFVLSIPEVDRQELLKDRNKVSSETVLLNLENIDIDGYEGYSRTGVDYNSFNLNSDYAKNKYLKEDKINLSSNLFRAYSYEFLYKPIISSDYLFSSVEFTVSDTNLYGKLYVKLNGKIVSEVSPVKGQKFSVAFSNTDQVNGNNLIEIVPNYIGLNPFNKLDMQLEDINYVENYVGSSTVHKNSFYIKDSQEVSEIQLNFLSKSTDTSPRFSIFLNDKFINSFDSDGEYSINLNDEYSRVGVNIIEYRLDSKSDIEFILPKLFLKSERQFKSDFYSFEIDDRLARIIINDRVNCMLYSNSNSEYEVEINGNKHQIKNYQSYSKDVCESFVFGDNNLRIISGEDVTISNLELILT